MDLGISNEWCTHYKTLFKIVKIVPIKDGVVHFSQNQVVHLHHSGAHKSITDLHYYGCSMLDIRAIPLYTSLSFRNWWDLSKEVLYDLVAWSTSKLPVFKAERLSGTRVLHSKSGNRCHLAGFEGWQLCSLSTYKVKRYLFGRISSNPKWKGDVQGHCYLFRFS